MPVMNGIEFLERVKADPELRGIPVVVLTTSNEHDDKQQCFGHSVAGYMTKPVGYANFKMLMQTIDEYWTRSSIA
jgi:CheY-like chemotaxis protein